MSSHPLSRSLSLFFPQTDVELAKERKKARTEQKNRDFTRRVKELRKWLQAYRVWIVSILFFLSFFLTNFD
jgi:archaellum biogenesis protein FlaJ (TadC family)